METIPLQDSDDPQLDFQDTTQHIKLQLQFLR